MSLTSCDPVEKETVAEADGFRIIQIHPSLYCNLTCKHCYSSSSPAFRMQHIAKDDYRWFLTHAKANGYNTVSISGGEPFLYPDLDGLIALCKGLGYYILVVTNGLLFKAHRVQKMLKSIDLIAVSIDGPKHLHDDIRNQPGSFDKLVDGVKILRSVGTPFGFIHTLTPRSWPYLIDLAAFANDHGAKLLQLHPIEIFGRAVGMKEERLDQVCLHKIFILRSYLESKYFGVMQIQLDLLHKEYLRKHPESINLDSPIRNIVIDTSGDILPISFGLSTEFNIGNIYHHNPEVFDQYRETKERLLRKTMEHSYSKLLEGADDLVNWNEIIIEASHHI